jgi:hypothetical protein
MILLAALAGLRTPHRHAELFRAPLLKRTASRWARGFAVVVSVSTTFFSPGWPEQARKWAGRPPELAQESPW